MIAGETRRECGDRLGAAPFQHADVRMAVATRTDDIDMLDERGKAAAVIARTLLPVTVTRP